MKNLVLGVVLVCATGLLGCRQGSEEADASPSSVPTQVISDFEMNDVRNGIKTMVLQSPEARVFDAQKLADVDHPVVLFYKNGKISSRLSAPAGRLKIDTHEVETWGGVTVVSADSSTLTTEHLNYDPKKAKIYSDDPVRLVKPDSVTEGVGLETDPDLRVVKIKRQKVRFKKGIQK